VPVHPVALMLAAGARYGPAWPIAIHRTPQRRFLPLGGNGLSLPSGLTVSDGNLSFSPECDRDVRDFILGATRSSAGLRSERRAGGNRVDRPIALKRSGSRSLPMENLDHLRESKLRRPHTG